MPQAPDPTPEEYYGPCLSEYPAVNNKASIENYFTATEPGEMPRHTTVLSTTKAESIMGVFVSRLTVDVARNALKGWVRGSPLPHPRAYNQPLAEPEQ